MGGRGDSVESDVGKEDHPGSGENTAPPIFPEASGIRGDKRGPVVGVDVSRTAEDEENDDREFDDDDDVVEIGGFPDANDEQAGHRQADEDRRQIEEGSALAPCAMVKDKGGGAKSRGNLDAEILEKFHGIAGPANGNGGGGKKVFQDKIPADDPGEELAQRGIGVGVGAAGGGNHGGIFGITEAGKETADAGDGEGEDESRAGMLGGGGAGQNKDPSSNDGSDAEEG